MPSAQRRRFARRAALILLCCSLLFFLGQIAIGYSVEHSWSHVRDPEYSSKRKRLAELQNNAPDQPLILFLGSSRTDMGVCAGQVRAEIHGQSAIAFNFGVSGGGSLLESVCLRRLLAEGIHPDLLVLEVLPPTLNQPNSHPVEEDWLDGSRLRTSEITFLRRYHSNPAHLQRGWSKARALPCVWQRHSLRISLLGESADTIPETERIQGTTDQFGWTPFCLPEVTPDRHRTASAFAQRQYKDAFGDLRLAAGPALALEEMLILCRQKDVRVVLLLMPESSEFRGLNSPSMREGIDEFLLALCTRWDLPLVDAREWLPDDAFWDSHHLLPRGAKAFTDRFEQELRTRSVTPRSTHRPG
jgi:hypothetical protein